MKNKQSKMLSIFIVGIFFIIYLISFSFQGSAKLAASDFALSSYPDKELHGMENELKLLSSFSTYYGHSNESRKSNIQTALKYLDKVMLSPNEEFSFNKIVGVRSKERGFQKAKIIENNKYVDGMGGGVCQVSTTVYNAAILLDLAVTEFHAHSLPPSYVLPSFDAMVSFSTADLKFINSTKGYLVIKTRFDQTHIYVDIYGTAPQSNYVIKRKSVVLAEIAPKTQILVDKENEYPDLMLEEGEERILFGGRPGLKSEGYLEFYDGEKLVKTKKIREDVYHSQSIIKVIKPSPNGTPSTNPLEEIKAEQENKTN